MRVVFWAAATAMLSLACPKARAASPDTSQETSPMPELRLPQATPAPKVSIGPLFTYSVTVASNYIFRGVSQTENVIPTRIA